MKIDGSGQRKTSERHVLPRTREAGGAHRIQVIAWQSVLLSGIRHDKLVHRYPRGIILWRSQTGHLPRLIHEIGFFHGHRGLDRVLIHEIGLFHGDIEVWIGSLAIKLAFIMADEVRQGGRTVLQARRPTHNYPRGDPDRGGNAHFADNPCLFTGKMVYLRPHNFRAG